MNLLVHNDNEELTTKKHNATRTKNQSYMNARMCVYQRNIALQMNYVFIQVKFFNDIRENNNRIWLLKQLLLSMVTVAMVQPYQEQANTIGYAH